MPFIRGRYYVNALAGGAIEAAREAEEGLKATPDADSRDDCDSGKRHEADLKPLRRIEIEVAELVPAATGHSTRGYVTRVQRQSEAESDESFARPREPQNRVFYDQGQLIDFLRDELAKDGSGR